MPQGIGLKRDIQSLNETNSNLNETIANKQIKYLEIMIKYEYVQKSKDTKIFNVAQFECGKCDDKFDTKAKLDKHLKLQCDVCGEIFTTILQIKKHENFYGHY